MQLKTWQRRRLFSAPVWPRRAILDHASTVAAVTAASVAFALFLATLSRDLTWRSYGGDGGELITASMTLGIAHPPGYPLYIIIGRLFGLLPFGTVAGRYALLSAIAGAAAVGVAVHCMIAGRPYGGRHYGLAWAMGLALSVTPLFWEQATIAEVYPLFLLFVALFVWAVLAERSPLVIGLTLGLAVSGHLSGLLLAPLALWKTTRSGLPRFGLGAAIGLAPFLWLPWLATNHSPVTWGDPSTLGGWWWLASASLYRPNVFGLPLNMWLTRLDSWLNLSILVPLLLWLAGALLAIRRGRRGPDRLPLALLLTALAFSIYAFTYRPEDSAVLLLPALLLAAIVAGRGLADLDSPKSWLLPMSVCILALVARPHSYDSSLRISALASLAELPQDAIVLTPGDESVSALWYFHYVEGVRPDIAVIDANMFQFPWYRSGLQREFSDLWIPDGDQLELLVGQNGQSRPVCRLSLLVASGPECNAARSEAALE
jgi:hypothetical protein